jgi:heterodisulfide reductase subunit B
MHTPRPLQLLGQPLAHAATASVKKQSATRRAADLLVEACIFIFINLKPKRERRKKKKTI